MCETLSILKIVLKSNQKLHSYFNLKFCNVYLGKTSKNQVLLVLGKATLKPDIRGECNITAPTSYLDAKSTVGTVPILCPYKITFFGSVL